MRTDNRARRSGTAGTEVALMLVANGMVLVAMMMTGEAAALVSESDHDRPVRPLDLV